MSPRTRQHLTTAMEAEAYSFAKCSRFAAHARMNENHEVAMLFQDTADVDRCEHFEKEFSLANLTGNNLENLSAAVDEKSRQIEMYSRFHEEALSDGDAEAATLFATIRVDELTQLEALQRSAQKLKVQAQESRHAAG